MTVPPCVSRAADFRNKLALGATYGGAQIHWGFAKKWALEARGLKGEQTSTEGTLTSTVYSLRGYRYFRAPSRLRFYMGLEGASTHSKSNGFNAYETTGFAAGGFGGSEIYLMRRLSVGVDVGPYLISSSVRRTDTAESEFSIVINAYLNFYFL